LSSSLFITSFDIIISLIVFSIRCLLVCVNYGLDCWIYWWYDLI
jgi:hypothetical protein